MGAGAQLAGPRRRILVWIVHRAQHTDVAVNEPLKEPLFTLECPRDGPHDRAGDAGHFAKIGRPDLLELGDLRPQVAGKMVVASGRCEIRMAFSTSTGPM